MAIRNMKPGELQDLYSLNEQQLLSCPLGTTLYESKYGYLCVTELRSHVLKRSDGKYSFLSGDVSYLISNPSKMLVTLETLNILEKQNACRLKSTIPE